MKDVAQGKENVPLAIPPGLSMPNDFPPLIAPSKTISMQESQSLAKQLKTNQGQSVMPATSALPHQPKQDPDQLMGEMLSDSSTISSKQKKSTKNGVQSSSKDNEGLEPIMVEEVAFAEEAHEARLGTKSAPKSLTGGHAVEVEGTTGKRQRPEKLNIDLATKSKVEAMVASNHLQDSPKSSTPRTALRGVQVSSGIVSQPSTPLTSVSQSSASSVTKQPRTLRVVQPSQPEIVPKTAITSTNTLPASVDLPKQVSRQASLASVRISGTPIHDTFSDSASFTSASVSRPPSPRENKVGSAPVRQKTKSQLKKERQARAKQTDDLRLEESPTSPAQEEVIQGPIIGRKKKTKKPATSNLASHVDNTEATLKQEKEELENTASIASPTKSDKSDKTTKKSSKKASTTPANSKATTAASRGNDAITQSRKENSRGGALTPATVLAELQEAGLISARALELFLNVPGIHHRFDFAMGSHFNDHDPPKLSNVQRRALDYGHAVCVEMSQQEYAIVLPDKSILRHLSYDEAQKYLTLREDLISSGSSVFHSSVVHDKLGSRASLAGSSSAALPDDLYALTAKTSIGELFGDDLLPGTDSSHEDIAERISTMTAKEAEQALRRSEELFMARRKEVEALEKRLNPIIKRNRKALRDLH